MHKGSLSFANQLDFISYLAKYNQTLANHKANTTKGFSINKRVNYCFMNGQLCVKESLQQMWGT